MNSTRTRLASRDAEALYEAVNQLIRVHQFRDRDRICCYDVSVAQCYALETLVKQGPLRLQALAQVMFLDKSTASRIVDSLERKGYVTRIEDAADRRAVQLEPTAAGRKLYQTIRADLVAEEFAMIEHMKPEVLEASLDLLRQLTRAAQARCGVASTCAVEFEP
ncbi:MarR family transcriptional regulator [Achromobacter marplatensis]|uniref:MarR family transcriptional regulator n=3 Tax=Achromobacter TaxID=222 RepID=A0A424WC08_ALCXX|nr:MULTISPECIES: MarR family transcriptional regulator [Achromobacter]MBC9906524.1 MarR family transcriptional regulator [Achromobacter xylosoxidans]MBD0870082.1 MarR family transcriptional regulator [Achromobacter xylosoxidans]OWT61662.1 MarR family transcriptional regulator [Achromobacter marplatensis]PND32424.1 MarR family transcriptional regulator [Achromobacter pulmonis]QNP87354.1 MarR family transcriptional regulator [Achromobacter xylosoxidans]